MRKYDFTGKTLIHHETKYRQIISLKSFENVSVGDVGGWIETEKNLSHFGNCWVKDNSKIGEDALVYGNAIVEGNSIVLGNSHIFGSARISENVIVYGRSKLFGRCEVSGNAHIYQSACVSFNAKISGKSKIRGNTLIKNEISSGEIYSYDIEKYNINYSGKDSGGNDFVRVGCQIHSITNWKDDTFRNQIVQKYSFPKRLVSQFLKILEEIENEISI